MLRIKPSNLVRFGKAVDYHSLELVYYPSGLMLY